MAMITYDNKTTLNPQPSIARINKVTDDDMNEIKSVVNTNYGEVGDITTLTTTNKSSVVSAVNELKSGEIYSTTEVKTNKVWINGKPIYRKCYEFTPSKTSASINTGITNLEKVILFSALPVYNGGTYAGMQYTSTTDKANIYISSDGTKFESRTLGSDIPTWRIIVEYTKTTD